ncbi:MAG: hypothetical protein NC548_20535 [Lachnospiraceae bacterium]|nr:hypothetical protein [Lachnospiraceae bacterium]
MMGLILTAMSFLETVLSGGKEGFWIAFLLLGVFAVLYGCYMAFWGAKKQVMSAIRQKNKREDGAKLTYILGEDIEVHSDKTDARLEWDLIEDAGEISHYIYLWCSGSAIILDKDRLSSEELSELSGLLKRVG